MATHAVIDCHMHILDRRYPLWPGAVLDPPDALVREYTEVRRKVGITHCVVAAPSIYGADNSCTRDAIRSLGIPAVGTAVLTKDTTPGDIARLDQEGFVAARFNCVQGGPWKVEDIAPIAQRIADADWHVQVYARPSQLLEMADVLRSLPTPLVIEHIGRIRDPHGEDAQAFDMVRRLADRGRTWVKLSAPYIEADATQQQADRFAKTVAAFVAAMPERLLWGSDWPHATEKERPDTPSLFTRFCSFVGEGEVLDRILAGNPRQLYGFD